MMISNFQNENTKEQVFSVVNKWGRLRNQLVSHQEALREDQIDLLKMICENRLMRFITTYKLEDHLQLHLFDNVMLSEEYIKKR